MPCSQSARTLTLALVAVCFFLHLSTAYAQKGGGRGKGHGGKVSRGGGSVKSHGWNGGDKIKSRGSGSYKGHPSGGKTQGSFNNQRAGGVNGKYHNGGNKHYSGGHYGGGNNYRGGGAKYGGGIYGGSKHAGGGNYRYKNNRHYGRHGHGFSQIYLGPGGIGYSYFGRGFGISVGLPLGGYYDYFAPAGYVADSLYPPYYEAFAPPVDTVAVVDPLVQPIPPASAAAFNGSATVGLVIETTESAAEFQRLAELAFREHRYADAARLVHHALIEDRNNGKLHLFASQALFALGDYQASAAAIQSGATLLNRNEWGYVVENYDKFYRGDDYITQMDNLIEFMKENPNTAYSFFLTGYHYKFLGYDDVAYKFLARAVQLEDRDRLAAELMEMTDAEPLPAPAPAAPVPESESDSIDSDDGLSRK